MWYGAASLIGSFLLFFLQPLAAKAITPWYGGGASVWVTCMVFFQAVLLVGYGYAHLLTLRSPLQRQGPNRIRALILALAAVLASVAWAGAPFLPLPALAPGTPSQPVLRILGTLALSVGLPMALLSSTSPLVQAWYARAEPGRTPYRLYALSNAGSISGLLVYPFLAEPLLSLRSQAWTAGILFLFWAWAMHRAWQRTTGSATVAAWTNSPAARPGFTALARWAGLSALGSMLLVGGSNVLGWHIAAVPLLWVLPLLLYLLTFILVFERDLPVGAGLSGLLLRGLFLAAVAGMPYALYRDHLLLFAVLGGTVVFIGCLLIHGRLASLRPGHDQLTWFYLALAAGGVVGGIAAGVLAPLLFTRLHEFGLAILATGLLGLTGGGRSRFAGWGGKLLSVGTILAAAYQIAEPSLKGNPTYRDFYGALVVDISRPQVKVMLSGATIHGIELKGQPLEPLAYFGPTSGIGRSVEVARSWNPHLRIGIIGLGVGNAAAYARAGDHLRVYEISPKVIELSGPVRPLQFHVLSTVPAPVTMVEGDARLSLEREFREGGSQAFDLLLVDAFSGGNIPWHLLTLEALDGYLKHLGPNGMLVFHVSNHFPVHRLVLRLLQERNLDAARLLDPGTVGQGRGYPLYLPSIYVVASRQETSIMNNAIAPAADGLLVPQGAGRYGRGFAERERLLQAELARTPLWRDGKNGLSSLLWMR